MFKEKQRSLDHLSDDHIRTLLLDDEVGPLPTKEEIQRGMSQFR